MAGDQLLLSQEIPDKLYFKIGEVAELAGVPSYVLRFWESEFSSIRPKRTDSGQRLYRKIDVETILTIKHLLHEKRFTIEGAKQHLRYESQPEEGCEGPTLEYIGAAEYYSESNGAGTPPNIEHSPAEPDRDKNRLLKQIYVELQHIHELLAK